MKDVDERQSRDRNCFYSRNQGSAGVRIEPLWGNEEMRRKRERENEESLMARGNFYPRIRELLMECELMRYASA